MRGTLPGLLLAALLSHAACSVDVEGAKCETPGSTEYCPEGQVCGTGLTCSTKAASCAAGAPCVAGTVDCRAGSNDVMECSAAGDPACGTWAVKTACSTGVTQCGVPASGPPVCRCTQFIVDPAGYTAGRACRYVAIQDAVTDAQAWSVGTVLLGGATGQVYGTDFADLAPIVIPAGMTVAGLEFPAAGGNRVIAVQGSSTSEGIRIEAGGRLAGVTVVRGPAPSPALAVRVAGASPAGGNSLEQVVVDAGGTGGPFAIGVRVEGSGDVRASAVTVLGGTAAGIEIDRADGSQIVTIADAVVDGNAVAAGNGLGVSLLKGDVTLVRPFVKRSSGVGLVASAAAAGDIRMTIQNGAIHDNFGTGLFAQALSRLHLTDTLLCNNKGGAPRNINGTFRLIGGAYAGGAVPADQAFSGNRFFDNDGDQVALGLGAGTWNLDGPSVPAACVAGLNAFAVKTAGSYGLVAASNATAQFNGWPNGSPTATTNTAVPADVLKIGSPTVTIGSEGTNSNYCSLPAMPTCPVP